MGRPHYGWWGYVKDIIRRYPDAVTPWEHDAVRAAIEQTERMRNGHDRLRIIGLVYWERVKYSIAGAAMRIHRSDRAAAEWHGDFIKAVARNFRCDGLMK